MATATDFLSTYLAPLAENLTPLQAREILAVKPARDLVDQIHILADKAESGTLTEQERAEYEYYINVDETIGLLRAKARRLLAAS